MQTQMKFSAELHEESEKFFTWFKDQGGIVDTEVIGLYEFEDSGRGAISLRDIQKDEVLFDIPRDLVLSTRTCALQSQLTDNEWNSLGKGWNSLILCMMWEESKGDNGKWAGYFASMPTQFTTPMFWDSSELLELEGSVILDKIGRTEAEAEYREKVLPLLQQRPDIFPEKYLKTYFSLERFHIQGSRILSRSFHVEKWQDDNQDDNQEEEADIQENHSSETDLEIPNQDAMEVEPNIVGDEEEFRSTDEDEDDAEDTADVGMTPLADLLNARYGCNNARLFYEKDYLRMIATKHIKKGDQIWNTYGDPPNSDLLRRYGHTDLVETPYGLGNPSDVVELNADIVTSIVKPSMEKERVDLFLEEGGDDAFVFDTSFDLPNEFMVFIRLLTLDNTEWAKAHEKNKLPKVKNDPKTLKIAEAAVRKRIEVYPTSLEDDEKISLGGLPFNKRNALIVRMGEKRILRGVLEGIQLEISKFNIGKGGEKRKRTSEKGTEGRKKNKR